jgi:hypothetical protein
MPNVDFNQIMQSAGVAVRNSRVALEQVQAVQAQNAGLVNEVKRLAQNSQDLQSAISRVQVNYRSGDPHIQRVENIPGRRIPFDMLVDIPVRASDSGTLQGSITIDQEGPFVATARMATFLSAASFTVRGTGSTLARFQARSFGRYRPIHSAWDLGDGHPFSQIAMPLAFPGSGNPHMASPSNQASFRTMQGDFRVQITNAGSSYPRSNMEVPSTFWTKAINSPWELGALDFFERNEVITVKVLPQHPNNPQYGNVQQFAAGNTMYPTLSSQWDCVEGIDDRVLPDETTDPVTRVYDGILTIGFHGYRIIQPAGAGPY